MRALDKCGLESRDGRPLAGLDTGPLVDGDRLTLTTRSTSADSGVRGASGAITSPVSVLRQVSLYDLAGDGRTPISAAFLPDASGGFGEVSVGARSFPRVYATATDKAGLAFTAVVRHVDAVFDLVGHVPGSALPTPAALYPMLSDGDPLQAAPGLAPLLGNELGDPELQATFLADGARATTTAGPDPGSGPQGFTQLPFPDGRYDSAAAWDPVRHKLVVFGGLAGGIVGDTWEFDGASWIRRAPDHQPSPRYGHALAWDGAHVLLFGGQTGSAFATLASDTWSWDGNDWSALSPVHAPARRYLHAMSGLASGVVLFGGADATGILGDTWVFSGGDWTRVIAANAPPGRAHATLTWDGARALLFGGSTIAQGSGSNDLWAFNGAAWSQLSTAHQPLVRRGHGAAWDAARGRLVTYGGYPASPPALWEFDGTDWSSLAPFEPGTRFALSMDYDPVGQRVLAFGGAGSNGLQGDVWAWDGAAWTHLSSAPAARLAASLAYDLARDRLVLFDGTPDRASTALNETWEFDGAAWSKRSVPDTLTERTDAASAYDTARRRVFAFGGFYFGNPNEPSSVLSSWDGTAWTASSVPQAQRPPARGCAGLAYDSARGRLVLFGGRDYSGFRADTWEFDGASWVEVQTPGAPPARWQHAMVYDAARGKVVLFGGDSDAGPYGDTWEYSGGDWLETTPTPSPAARSRHGMAYDAHARKTVLFGGGSATAQAADGIWTYDAGVWSQLAAPGAPPARFDAAMAYDSKRSRVVWFGGTDVPDRTATETVTSIPGSSELWSFSMPWAHDRQAAQLISFPLDAASQPDALAVSYSGLGDGASPGVGLAIWSWTAQAWRPLGTNTAVAADPLESGNIPATLAPPVTDYWGKDFAGKLWLLATPLDPGAGTSSVSTDFVQLTASYTVP